MLKTIKLTNENRVLSVEEVRKASIRLWSPIRCMMSPIILVSKKAMGSFISLMRKSEMMEMLMRVLMWSRIHERMNSTAVCAT